LLTRKEIDVLTLRKKGLTQIDVAKKLKITQAAVSNFEKNAHRKIIEAKKTASIAKKLCIEVNSDE